MLIIHHREGQKMRRRNFPKGYAEIPEKQHNQLVGSLTEMYRGFQRASLCSDEISGRLLTHVVLATLDLLDLQADDTDARFIEQPRSKS